MTRAKADILRQARRLYRVCLQDGLLDENRAKRVVQLLRAAGRRESLALIRRFRRLVAFDRQQHTAEVDSAVPLAVGLQDDLRAGIEHMYGRGITTKFVEQPALIGGVRIRVGSDVYDDTIKGRLAALETQF